jgi:hypothetical protein
MSDNSNNRPYGRVDAQGRIIPDSFNDEEFRGVYTGTNMTYKGFARPGADEADPVWQIAKLTYDGADNLLTVKWPENVYGHASTEYTFVWDDGTPPGPGHIGYANYTYS